MVTNFWASSEQVKIFFVKQQIFTLIIITNTCTKTDFYEKKAEIINCKNDTAF